MDHDDEEGVGFIRPSHYLKNPTIAEQQAMALLQVPKRSGEREGSISSSVSDMDIPIYSTEQLTTSIKREPDGSFNLRLGFAILAGAFGSSFQHGYNTGVLNNPQKVIENWIKETMYNRSGTVPSQESVTLVFSIVTAIFCVGGVVGGSSTAIVADWLGRKRGLLLNNVLVLAAALCEGCSKLASSYELLILGRFLIGVNSGLNAGLAPIYITEISPINLRGAVGTVYQLVITMSILTAQILGLKGVLGTESLWTVLLAMTIIPAIFQIFVLPFCPESPKHLLITKGSEQQAKNALVWLRGTFAVHEEMEVMKAEAEASKLIPKVTVRELITNSTLRIPLVISLVIMVAQQFSGINAVMFFSSTMFTMSGLSADSSTFATLGVGAINTCMTIVSLFLVERAGRKTLLLVGFSGMGIIALCLAIAMRFATVSTAVGIFCVILVLVFVVMFSIGPGSIPWFIVSELFNQSARPTASSLAVCVNWIANFIVGLAFLPLANIMGSYVFLIFFFLQIGFVAFIYKHVPETKNKTLEEISAMFRQQSYK